MRDREALSSAREAIRVSPCHPSHLIAPQSLARPRDQAAGSGSVKPFRQSSFHRFIYYSFPTSQPLPHQLLKIFFQTQKSNHSWKPTLKLVGNVGAARGNCWSSGGAVRGRAPATERRPALWGPQRWGCRQGRGHLGPIVIPQSARTHCGQDTNWLR